ncbi:MAG TPA: PEP-CTERM sorting domain-containing protein, partial [Armatimonadota bacterium]|nr:PEP-CTERM sorting domain-containing protein [Armatimonadota bacterium]
TDPTIVFGGSLASQVAEIPGAYSTLDIRSDFGSSTMGWQNLQTTFWVETVPEPSSIIVLLSGGLGSIFALRRRKV